MRSNPRTTNALYLGLILLGCFLTYQWRRAGADDATPPAVGEGTPATGKEQDTPDLLLPTGRGNDDETGPTFGEPIPAAEEDFPAIGKKQEAPALSLPNGFTLRDMRAVLDIVSKRLAPAFPNDDIELLALRPIDRNRVVVYLGSKGEPDAELDGFGINMDVRKVNGKWKLHDMKGFVE